MPLRDYVCARKLQRNVPPWKVALAMVSNVGSVVGLVAMNKYIQKFHGFGASFLKGNVYVPFQYFPRVHALCVAACVYSDRPWLVEYDRQITHY